MVPSSAAGKIKGVEQLTSWEEHWSQQSQPPSLAPKAPPRPQWEGPGSVKSSRSWEGNLAAGSLPAFSSIIRSFFFLTTSSVSRAWNWQKSLFRHSAKELRGLFQKKLSTVGGHLCSGLSSRRGVGSDAQAWPCHWALCSLRYITGSPGLSLFIYQVDPLPPHA